jgi:hypothetical protein
MGVVAGLVRGDVLGPLLRYDTEHRADWLVAHVAVKIIESQGSAEL